MSNKTNGRLPGDEFVQQPMYETTETIIIKAPTSTVWQWIVQIGVGRGGFYTYDVLENAIGLNVRSARTIRPEWQTLSVGDSIPISPITPLTVQVLDPNRALVLHAVMSPFSGKIVDPNVPSTPTFIDWTWAFVLDSIDPLDTRLTIRTRANFRPGLLRVVAPVTLKPVHLLMEHGMLQGIKARAENHSA